jgi:hypothetical protein
MILVVETLRTEIQQSFSLSLSTRILAQEIKPYVLMYNSPVGTFTLSIEKDSVEIFSTEFASENIKSFFDTTHDYIHGRIPLSSDLILTKGDYVAKLTATGYTYNQDSFLGWVRDWEGFFIPELTELATARPNDLRIITYDDPYIKLR